ncbi:MAG: RnfABCDGE type electron transport complex subunit D, partial [Spirochaetes bacterium]|nr:RnfABCDGE type electron transport complex subunit D [Spirochaetota bacterium]
MENKLEEKLIISSSPHLLKEETTKNIMWLVSLCLLPAGIFGIYAFGFHAALIIITSILSSVITEAIILKLRKKRIPIDDGSAFLTGLLIGLNMPPGV